jgi:hypothetical protein
MWAATVRRWPTGRHCADREGGGNDVDEVARVSHVKVFQLQECAGGINALDEAAGRSPSRTGQADGVCGVRSPKGQTRRGGEWEY